MLLASCSALLHCIKLNASSSTKDYTDYWCETGVSGGWRGQAGQHQGHRLWVEPGPCGGQPPNHPHHRRDQVSSPDHLLLVLCPPTFGNNCNEYTYMCLQLLRIQLKASLYARAGICLAPQYGYGSGCPVLTHQIYIAWGLTGSREGPTSST